MNRNVLPRRSRSLSCSDRVASTACQRVELRAVGADLVRAQDRVAVGVPREQREGAVRRDHRPAVEQGLPERVRVDDVDAAEQVLHAALLGGGHAASFGGLDGWEPEDVVAGGLGERAQGQRAERREQRQHDDRDGRLDDRREDAGEHQADAAGRDDDGAGQRGERPADLRREQLAREGAAHGLHRGVGGGEQEEARGVQLLLPGEDEQRAGGEREQRQRSAPACGRSGR